MPRNPLENPEITNIRLRITALKKEFIKFNKTVTHVTDDYDKEIILRTSTDLIKQRDEICHDLYQLKVFVTSNTPEALLLTALSKHCYISLHQKYELSGLPFPFS